MIRVDAGVEAGGFAVGRGVGRAADRFEGPLKGQPGGIFLRPFEEHMLKEV